MVIGMSPVIPQKNAAAAAAEEDASSPGKPKKTSARLVKEAKYSSARS